MSRRLPKVGLYALLIHVHLNANDELYSWTRSVDVVASVLVATDWYT